MNNLSKTKFVEYDESDQVGVFKAGAVAILDLMKQFCMNLQKDDSKMCGLTWSQIYYLIDELKKKEPIVHVLGDYSA